jgi:hypothetical protein
MRIPGRPQDSRGYPAASDGDADCVADLESIRVGSWTDRNSGAACRGLGFRRCLQVTLRKQRHDLLAGRLAALGRLSANRGLNIAQIRVSQAGAWEDPQA